MKEIRDKDTDFFLTINLNYYLILKKLHIFLMFSLITVLEISLDIIRDWITLCLTSIPLAYNSITQILLNHYFF